MSTLALLGGSPCVRGPLPPFRTIGDRERVLVNEVLDGGLLSGFYGSWSPEFFGGPFIQRFEAEWSAAFGVKHSVSVNSNTTGLLAAAGAIGLSPGDEVIVPPYTMSATAIAPLFYGGIPVFVDIEADTFCLDPAKVEEAIGPRTKAIFATNLFGHPAQLAELRKLADRHHLFLVEDNAQGPFAEENGCYAGTIGHIGVFSLNVHKHIQAGEGGVCTTDDDVLAMKMRAIRNHGENVVTAAGLSDIVNTIGLNLRMSELTAAVGIAQLEKGRDIVADRIVIAEQLSKAVAGLPGLRAPIVRSQCRHVYYVWPLLVSPADLGISRSTFVKALFAEGVPVMEGYVAPLYRLPAFRHRLGIGRDGFPFALTNRRYDDVVCPIVERMHEDTLIAYEICGFSPASAQLQQMGDAFSKVITNLGALQTFERAA
ncbi:DegT/DnrJ/EryC1/StrS family aminotransferase [Hyphomicrobium sp.]|uniref:DegT/DnrJ/EryC1/StrS family aminotransferase n=1 Tax=Hyphomicrobium sp. TaxID=82 RepID=UPI0025C0A035|nr:DegT/DnrJ/EryC1/StrS family aminotransferase [Hyphomicrobium sp.]MCC7250950.1 DegT/DnrJ/EryC1/StrS family aminotransferase [Hyphomicrobium sp.]